MAVTVHTAADPAWEQADEEQAFWEEQATDFPLRYPDQYVAVHEHEVVAHASSLLEIIDALQAHDLKPAEVWMRYFSAHPMHLVL